MNVLNIARDRMIGEVIELAAPQAADKSSPAVLNSLPAA
jgi:hypothetical protein